MNITLFITANCQTCRKIELQLNKLLKTTHDIHLIIEDIRKVNSKGIIIAPALFIGDELYSYGDLNEEKFLERISLIQTRN